MSTIALSGTRVIDALLVSTSWSKSVGSEASITYSFPQESSLWRNDYGLGEPEGLVPLTATQQNNFIQALELISDVANIRFTRVEDNENTHGDIRAAFSSVVIPSAAAWAYIPNTGNTSEEDGDVWFNTSVTDMEVGSMGFSTVLHELGHSLGLKHSFKGELSNNNVLSTEQDSSQYTMMSYTDYEGAGQVYTDNGGGRYSAYTTRETTPMLYDILALQYLYGANTTTRLGDDVYTFSNTQGELKTIWDAGGIDTIDLSNQSLDMQVNLNDGEFSQLVQVPR